MGYVGRMNTNHDAKQPAGEAEKLYCIRVTRGNGPMDEQLAAAMREVHEASLNSPNGWGSDPEAQRAKYEGLGKLLAEWQEENGAFTEEELARARASMYGP